jgi:hypothetical protein
VGIVGRIIGDLQTSLAQEDELMRTLRIAAAIAALFGSALLLPAVTEAQNAATPSIPRIFNRPVPKLQPAVSSVQFAGTVKVTITASITSNIPNTQPISCEVELLASDVSFFNDAFVSAPLTRTGKTGTCTISVPYIFVVASPTTPLEVGAALLTQNSKFTASNEASFTQVFPSVPKGTTTLKVSLGI